MASEAIPLAAFFASDDINPNEDIDAAGLLREADVIIGVDVMSEHEFIVFGREKIRQVASGEEPEFSLLKIAVDQGEESDDLERLIVLVEVVKGKHEYESYQKPTE